MACRICDLMTGQISTNNTVTFEGYVHCAAVMIKGMLEDQAVQLIYMAKGRRGEASYEECFEVSQKKKLNLEQLLFEELFLYSLLKTLFS